MLFLLYQCMQFHLCLPQFPWCSFVVHPSSPVTSHRFVCTHAQLQGHSTPSPFKRHENRDHNISSMGLYSCGSVLSCTDIALWANKITLMNRGRLVYSLCQGTLRVTHGQWGGETLEMKCSSQVSEAIKRKLIQSFCKPSSQITGGFQSLINMYVVL